MLAPIPFRSCPKADKDGVYYWPQHRLKYGRGSEKPAAHTQQKMTRVPPPGGFSITYSSAIVSILAMVLLSIFFNTLVY